MRDVALFGAGQAGTMAVRLLSGEYRPICFIDNDNTRWNETFCELPILSPEEGLKQNPDCLCLCVVDERRAVQMEEQARDMGFTGEILRLNVLRAFDARAATLRLLAGEIEERAIPGDAAELGVYRGDFASLINLAFQKRTLHLFDTFKGFAEEDVQLERRLGLSRAEPGDFSETSVEAVRARMSYPERVEFYEGHFPESFARCPNVPFAFVSIDADLYTPTAAALPLFWGRLSPGGTMMIHDYNSAQFSGAGRAVREFCRKNNLYAVPVCDLHGSCVLIKP